MIIGNYTNNMGKYFPRENAHAGGILRYLLRTILTTRESTFPEKMLMLGVSCDIFPERS
jgi:hypothetical protein